MAGAGTLPADRRPRVADRGPSSRHDLRAPGRAGARGGAHPADRDPALRARSLSNWRSSWELLGDRLAFLCSWLLEFFLDPKPRLESEPDHLQVTIEVLEQKLAEEIERLREICAQGPYLSLHEILCDYRDWLCRRATVDECEDLE